MWLRPAPGGPTRYQPAGPNRHHVPAPGSPPWDDTGGGRLVLEQDAGWGLRDPLQMQRGGQEWGGGKWEGRPLLRPQSQKTGCHPV